MNNISFYNVNDLNFHIFGIKLFTYELVCFSNDLTPTSSEREENVACIYLFAMVWILRSIWMASIFKSSNFHTILIHVVRLLLCCSVAQIPLLSLNYSFNASIIKSHFSSCFWNVYYAYTPDSVIEREKNDCKKSDRMRCLVSAKLKI